MTTFSQMVDALTLETGRPDMRSVVCSYLNQTLRELHFDPKSGSVVFYLDNYREATVMIDSEDRQTWQVPSSALFQGEAAVRFDGSFSRDGRRYYAQRVSPGPRMEQEDCYYYRAGNTFVFGGVVGYGAIGGTISIAYFEYPPGLNYYVSGTRPAIYELETGWTYAEDYDIDDDTRLLAQAKTTNWLLMRWYMVIEEGLRAKIYKRLADQQRAATSYSLYMQLRQGLYTSEIADVSGYY